LEWPCFWGITEGMKRYRKTERGGGLFSAIEHEQAVAAKTSGILKLRGLIPWESFRRLLEELTGYATRDWTKGGKPPFDPVLMFKVLVLQKFHGLSDDATEEQFFDRTSFKAFLGLRIGDDIPDAKTLWDFKQRIEAEGCKGGRKLFDAFGQILEGKGLIAREGSIIDASFTDAPRQRNDREQNQRIKQGERPPEFDENPAVGRQKDSDARWTKKNNEVHYGWENHVKADLKTKLILNSTTTPVSVHESQVVEELLDDKDQAVEKAPKAHPNESRTPHLRSHEIKSRRSNPVEAPTHRHFH
jgi:transposase, IS5 family